MADKDLKDQLQDAVENADKVSTDADTKEPTVAEKPKKAEPKKAEKPVIAKNFEPTELVEVANNTSGNLIYISKSNGEQAQWTEFGQTQWMRIEELTRMRSSQPRFFTEAWIKPTNQDVIDFLRLNHYYKDDLSMEDIENLFKLDASEVETFIEKAPRHVKILILDKARNMVEEGTLTNVHIIKIIENKFRVVLLPDSED